MRGLIPALIMQRIEERTGLAMTDMVDIFAGASTGSILNAALNIPHPDDPTRPKYRARHLVRFYQREGIRIFPRDAFREMRGLIHDFNNRLMKIGTLNKLLSHGHYDPANLGRNLRALFGKTRLHDSLKSLIIPVYSIERKGMQADQDKNETEESVAHYRNMLIDQGGQAIWFRKLNLGGATLYTGGDATIYDCVMGSTAAPTYFPCHSFATTLKGRYTNVTGIDGSLFDNPCMTYMGALRHLIPDDTDLVMIVLGTGITNRAISEKDWNRWGSLGVVDPVNDLPLINIFFHASESALKEAFEFDMDENLYVLNKSLVYGEFKDDFPGTQLDDASPDSLRRMKNFSEMLMSEKSDTFNAICDLLVENYQEKNKKGFFSDILKR